VNINSNTDRDEAREILEALRQIQDKPELQAEAKADPDAVMNRLGLSGIARHSVALGIAVITVGANHVAHANSWWSS
jgi:hypothetical protein